MRVGLFFKQRILRIALKEYLCALNNELEGVTDEKKGVDIIVTDYSTLLSERFANRFPGASIVLLDTGLSAVKKRVALMFFMVRGIIPPNATPELFVKALKKVKDGDLWIDHATAEELLTNSRNGMMSGKIRGLTRREREIIPLVCRGMKNKEIATTMGISVPTVKAILGRVFRKFNVSSRSQLQAVVSRSGILNLL